MSKANAVYVAMGDFVKEFEEVSQRKDTFFDLYEQQQQLVKERDEEIAKLKARIAHFELAEKNTVATPCLNAKVS